MVKKILFVDDDTDLRKSYCQSLKAKGFDIIEASDGRAALNSLISRNPDMVVCEVMLPALNGFDLLQTIRQRPTTSKLPVILMTDLEDELDMAKKLGADKYLVKSQTNPDQLADIITTNFSH